MAHSPLVSLSCLPQFVLKPFNASLVDLMRGKKVGGYCHECFTEYWGFARGGAELMRLHLSRSGVKRPLGLLLQRAFRVVVVAAHTRKPLALLLLRSLLAAF